MAIVEPLGWPYDLLTLAEWERLDVGEGRHVECVEGVLVVAPSPYPRHQMIAGQLTAELNHQLPRDLAAILDTDVLLNSTPLTVRAPDVVVTPTRVFDANPPHFAARDVLLSVEVVSVGSRRTDRVMKLNEYAEAGIPTYWILEGDPLTLTVYALDKGTYRLVGTYQGSAEPDACGTTVRLDLDALTRR